MSEDTARPAPARFVSRRKQEAIEIEDEGGVARTYTLRELSGTGRDRFVNGQLARVKLGPDGQPVGVKDVTDSMAELIAASLFDDKGKPVSLKTIQEWSTTCQVALFKAAQELSSLGASAEADAKNG